MKSVFTVLTFLVASALVAPAADTILSASSFSQWRADNKSNWVLRVFTRDVASLALGLNAEEIRITEEQVADVAEFAIEEGFFELPDELGTKEIDLPVRSITLYANGHEKTVTIYGTRNPDGLTGEDIARTPQLEPFLRVWAAVRSLFDHPHAADDRKSDQRALREYRNEHAAK